MWEQLPLTDGILREEITKTKAPDMARRVSALLFSCRTLRIEKNPARRNGRQISPQAML